ncbi:MAG: hypothetical protein K2H46_06825 [Muribaculaceae bacterium]|nr:hypothetical protein [Muribaculaceae bacterium]
MFSDPSKFSLIKHHRCRRAHFHDYRSICSYLITIVKNPVIPDFSQVVVCNEKIETKLSHSGESIRKAFQNWEKEFPHIHIHSFVIMPDHVHLLIRVWKYLDKPLGNYIGTLKGRCTVAYSGSPFISSKGETTQYPLFKENFNDRILMRANQLNTWKRYILDNPRRLWIMRNHTNFFRRFSLYLPDASPLPFYGNPGILIYPEAIVVKHDSKASENYRVLHKKECLRIAANGGVLISPFIHPEEKRIGAEAYELGGRFLKIIPHPFGEKEKPTGKAFDWCAQGIMAYVAKDWEIPYGKVSLSRNDCERMNALACIIKRTAIERRVLV